MLLGLGFDQRSLSILEKLDKNSPEKVFGILNPITKGTPQTNYHEQFSQYTETNGEVIGKDSTSLIETIDLIQAALKKSLTPDLEIVIDITAFSHEMLIAIVGLFANDQLLDRTTVLYTNSTNYGVTTDSTPNWLSKGVAEIRSVLGFPGMMLPSKKLLLIVMAGFETERAAEVISQYEPAELAIGYGAESESVTSEHYYKNKKNASKITKSIIENNIVDCIPDAFEFSCTNPLLTRDSILSYINDKKQYNIVICPLNNKISTIGATLAALERPEIQLCYARPQEYNIAGYARPSEYLTIFEMKDR